MVEYIKNNGYEISGDAYEEYPVNEVGEADENSYLLRILIAVRRKG
jgi:effector-binding domain-containing protein